MVFTVEDFSELIRLLQEHPEWREQLRALILPQEVLSLPDRIAQLTEAVRELVRVREGTARQENTRLDSHEERLRRLEETVAQLVEAVRELVRITQEHSQRPNRIEKRLAKFLRFHYVVHYRERAGAYFGRLLKRARGLHPYELEELVEEHLTDEERGEFYLADVVVRGNWVRDEQPLYFVMEVSETVDANDVVRAHRRAAILRKAGLRAIAAVAGDDQLPEAVGLAAEQGVLVITDGAMENLEQAEHRLVTSA